MGEKKLVPLKRFGNFNGNWKTITVEEIGESYGGGGTPKTTKEDYWNGNIPWIQSSDLNEGDFFLSASRKQITELGLINSAAKHIKKNSIAVVTRVGFGKLALIPFEYTTSQDFLSISDLNIDKHFAVYILYKKLQKESKSLQGTSIKGITSGELLTKEIIIPSSSLEQQKIGEFFKVLDERIANQERKIAKVKALKAAYLTEMFPQEGETVPKRRFKGFTGEWELIKFKDIGNVKRGLTYKPSDVSYEGVRVLRSSNIEDNNFVLKQDDVFVTRNSIGIDYADNNNILITAANGSTKLIGKHAITKGLSKEKNVPGGFMLIVETDVPNFLNTSMYTSWYKKFLSVFVSGGNGSIGNL